MFAGKQYHSHITACQCEINKLLLGRVQLHVFGPNIFFCVICVCSLVVTLGVKE